MIDFDNVPINAAASAVFLEEKGIRVGVGGLMIQHRLVLPGQFNTGKTPTVNVPQMISSADEAVSLYGRGSMLHLMAKKAFAIAPYTPIYCIPLTGTGVAATSTIVVTTAVTKAGAIALFIAGQKVIVSVAAGDTTSQVATKIQQAINAALNLPVTATVATATVTLTCRWTGLTGNDIRIQKSLDSGDAKAEPTGGAITINAMTGGTTNPDLTTALSGLGGTWYTSIACPYQDATNLTAIEAAAEARHDPGVKKPFISVFGFNGTRANFQTAVSARNNKFCSWVPVEDSPNMPLEIAAAGAALFAARQQVNPGRPMRGRKLIGIRAGTAAAWTYTDEDTTVKAGGSTTRNNVDGTVTLIDFVTTYTTNTMGAPDDTYRFTAWLGNWQFKLYSLDTLFSSDPFVDAVVIDDKTPAGVSYAISPNVVKGYAIKLVDDLWVPLALTKERDAVVAGIRAEIDAGNPGRINALIPDVFSAGLRIIAGKVQWGFYAQDKE